MHPNLICRRGFGVSAGFQSFETRPLNPSERGVVFAGKSPTGRLLQVLGQMTEGMTQVARDSGLSRESLYKTLSGERNPTFATILKVTRALGIELHATAKSA